MNKQELIEGIAESSGLSETQAKALLQTSLQEIAESLKRKETVTLRGFGTFSTADRKKRIGRNPKTGGKVTVPKRTTAKFKTGKILEMLVNKNYSKG